MDKGLQIAGWSAVSFFIGMGAQFTGVPNFIVGVAFYAIGGIGFVILVFSNLKGKFALLTSALGAVSAGTVYLLMVFYAIVSSEKPKEPEVTAAFGIGWPTSIVLINKSEVSAEGIKWTPLLFNLDEAMRAANENRNVFIQPLQVPSQPFDFIRAHQQSLPMDIFQQRLGSLNLRDGDRLIGSVSVSCAKCTRGHTFIVFLVPGKNGWFWEQKENTTGLGIQPSNWDPFGILTFYNQIESSIPQDLRTTIYER